MGSFDAQIATVPTPEETYNVSLTAFLRPSFSNSTYQAMAPDLRRKVDENRRARLALDEGMRQQQNAQVGFTLQFNSYHTFCSLDAPQLDPESAKPNWADPPKH